MMALSLLNALCLERFQAAAAPTIDRTRKTWASA
jgi:hypothetical protein